nr:hypothetical protein CFP56_28782 [Quercus suber]
MVGRTFGMKDSGVAIRLLHDLKYNESHDRGAWALALPNTGISQRYSKLGSADVSNFDIRTDRFSSLLNSSLPVIDLIDFSCGLARFRARCRRGKRGFALA